MASVIAQLESIDLSQLTQQLASAKLRVSSGGAVELNGLDPRDLLGELGAILKARDGLAISPEAAAGSVAQALGQLGSLAQLPTIPAIGDLSSGLQRLIALLEDAVSKFGVGSGEIDIDALLPEISGLDAFFQDLLGRALDAIEPQIPAEVANAVEALKALAGGGPTSAEGMARLLATFVLGINLTDLQGAADALRDHLGRIEAAGGDFAAIHAEMRRLTATAQSIVASLEAPAVDVAQVELRIQQIRGDFGLLVHNTLPGAAARLALDLDAVDVDRLAGDLRARLAPLAATTRALPFDLGADLLVPLRALADQIETVTAAQLDQRFQELVQELHGVTQGSGIELLPRAVDELFDVVVDTMRELPVRRLRDDLIDELNAIEARIRGFDGFGLPAAIAQQLRDLESKVDGLDLGALQGRVADLSAKIQQVVAAFPVEAVKQQIEGVSQATADAIGQFSSALDPLKQQIDALAGRLDAIDFSEASDAVVALLAEIRQRVESALGSADVPDAAKAAIGVAASVLGEIDVSIEISAPFNAALDKVDISVITEPLDAVTAKVHETLEKVTPQAVIDELEAPFEQLSQTLERFRPEALVASLSAEFQRLVANLESARPQNLIAPLDAQFHKLTAAVRETLDPAPLFAPLKALYQKLLELVELLDMEKILGKILGKTADLPQLLGARLGDALHSRIGGGALPATDTAAELFQWGDLLRPLAALVAQLRAKVQKLAESVLGQVLTVLQAPLRALAALAAAGGGFLMQIADAVQRRYAMLDLFAPGGPAEQLQLALNDLDSAVASAALSDEGGVRVDALIAGIRVDLDAHAALDLSGQATARAATLGAALEAPDLASALRAVGQRVQDLVPDAWLSADSAAGAAAGIASLFDALDFNALADELDAIGTRIRTKLEGFAKQIAAALVKLWNQLYEAVLPITPSGMLGRIQQGMQRVRAEFTVLDPAVFEQEVREIVDALVDGLEIFSPASLAAQLNGIFDAVVAKLQQLDPAKLLGDLTPLSNVIDQLESLRPSVVLAPLLDSTQGLQAALEAVSSIDLGAALKAAVAKLRAQLEAVVAAVDAEFKALLSFLESQAGGGASVSASISV